MDTNNSSIVRVLLAVLAVMTLISAKIYTQVDKPQVDKREREERAPQRAFEECFPPSRRENMNVSSSSNGNSLFFYIHIWKTGGTTFSKLLRNIYTPEETAKGAMVASGNWDFSDTQWLEDDYTRKQVMYAHRSLGFGLWAFEVGARKADCMWEYGTILREPVSYARSIYRSVLIPKQHGKRVGYTSIREWYSDAKAMVESGCSKKGKYAKYAKYAFPMSIFLSDDVKSMIGCPGNEEEVLARGMARVQGMQWVGITEHFPESVCLFLTTRNKIVDASYEMKSSHRGGAERKHLSRIYGPNPPSDAEWTELLQMEIEFYKFGLSIFSARVATLHQEFEMTKETEEGAEAEMGRSNTISNASGVEAKMNAGSARPVIRTILAQKKGSFMREQCTRIISGEPLN
jgi:hypothetical protein